jgi:CDP-glucose 4,6-dehydratase
MGLDPSLWHGKRVLITGHTGFKGCWLSLILKELGAILVGVSLPLSDANKLYEEAKISEEFEREFFVDIRESSIVDEILRATNPDYVFHLAAQAFVRNSVRNPIDSISTNVLGTANVLVSSLKRESVRGVTIVTTDKVYENTTMTHAYIESDRLGGKDPYSASKAAAEIIVAAIQFSNNPFDIPVTTVRAGNVIGGGDWGEDRLIPDIVRSILSNSPVSIRNPNSTRPWQYILDCLYGYLLVAESQLQGVSDFPKSINFGPEESLSVFEIINLFETEFNRKIEIKIHESQIPENPWLALNSSLAAKQLGWHPKFSPAEAVKQTADWYVKFANDVNARQLMSAEISTFKVGVW